ncbi:MAG: restriction endonuclease [Flavobacteria bacterium RIFCSPLOWO2_12_FULL_35_11]|nr:MAG: restriction endonuclease [Flavobacteria bacterium RIFCSPLOWO2_12_FULL_35_11]
MTKDLIQINYRQEYVGIRTYKIKYIAEITHRGFNDFKVLTSDHSGILQNKVIAHIAKLEEKWDKIVEKENIFRSKEEIQKEANLLTKGAINALKEIDNILLHTLEVDDTVDWEQLKDKTKFNFPTPEKELNKLLSAITKPKQPSNLDYSKKPETISFQPRLSFLDKIIKSKKENKIEQANSIFEKALNDWVQNCKTIDDANQNLKNKFQNEISNYEKEIEKVKQKNISDIKNWEKEKFEFISNQEQANIKVDEMKQMYLKLDLSSVIEYCDLVLNNSQYPVSFPKSYEIDYNSESKILIVEYSLPSIEELPTLNEIKVIKNELKEYHISEAQLLKMFDATMYNITLRTLHELFEADIANAIEAISFNGWVNSINKATGKRENNCILSILAKKLEFMEINLKHVDPKTCFKNFKGIGSSKLNGLTAIQPILQISRTDRRFTNHYEVADSIDSSTNLASMDWEDFENLIREVFGKEFSSNGGEVKVTQASRDGGVDAIAFDPDPIRGGKIVIQAKRYTNTVGVSAVRDLYGTVMNEGATKGILVTTADYGPDAYEFVKGKPLTLMNGANLLYLLEKHGHQAKIDIKEARENMR